MTSRCAGLGGGGSSRRRCSTRCRRSADAVEACSNGDEVKGDDLATSIAVETSNNSTVLNSEDGSTTNEGWVGPRKSSASNGEFGLDGLLAGGSKDDRCLTRVGRYQSIVDQQTSVGDCITCGLLASLHKLATTANKALLALTTGQATPTKCSSSNRT